MVRSKSKKSGKSTVQSTGLPFAPWIYISDPCEGSPNAHALAAMIPKTALLNHRTTSATIVKKITKPAFNDTVCLIINNNVDGYAEHSLEYSNRMKEAAIEHANNYVSVYLTTDADMPKLNWGTNHLNLNISDLTPQGVAETVYKWLFKPLSVTESIYLIPESEFSLTATDTLNYPKYEYTTIADSKNKPKDANLQYVALITSKPIIEHGKRLTWTVADRTGIANFYFTYRGPSSQYTFDWVLALKVGERHALARMPSVLIREPVRKRILKSPFRAVGSVLHLTGAAVKGVGEFVGGVGKKISMGEGEEWVAEADVGFDAKGKAYRKVARGGVVVEWMENDMDASAGKSVDVKVFDSRGKRLWGDEDSLASTQGGSEGWAEKEVIV